MALSMQSPPAEALLRAALGFCRPRAILIATFGIRAHNGIELRRSLTANDTEKQEGYFAVAQDTVLMVRPDQNSTPA